MSRSARLLAVEDPDRRREFQAAASRIASRTANGKLGLVRRPGWVAVATQEGMLSTKDWRRTVATMLQLQGTEVLHAVALDSVYDEPPLEVPATEPGLGEMQAELGAWNFVVYPPDGRWAIVSTSEDIAAFLGPVQVVNELVGGDPAPVRSGLEEDFLDDDLWPGDLQAYFRNLVAAIESYRYVPEGEVVELPVDI